MNPLRLLHSLCALLLLLAAPALGQDGLPRLGEFKINTTTVGNQSIPRMARDAADNAIVVWQATGGIAVGSDIFMQRYNSAGSPAGLETRVNTDTSADQSDAAVACAPDGRFVVVWYSDGTGGEPGVFARRYDANGNPRDATQLRVTDPSSPTIDRFPDVMMDRNGNFVVVWAGYQRPNDLVADIYFRRFSDAGTRLGSGQVNVSSAGDQTVPKISANPDGDFVVVFRDQQNGNHNIRARRYRSDGSQPPPDAVVHPDTSGGQYNAAVAMAPDTSYVVVWDDDLGSSNPSATEVRARRFDSAGNGGAVIPVNTYTDGRQLVGSVALHTNGEFIAVWSSQGLDNSGFAPAGRRFSAADLSIDANDFQLNTYTTGDQNSSSGGSVAYDSKGNLFAIWSSNQQDGDQYGLYADLFYRSNQGPPLSEFRVNTTTKGDQKNPTVAMNTSGEAIVVWEAPDQDMNGIWAQRYSANGRRVGAEFLVNGTQTGNQTFPVAGIDQTGDFAVAWVSGGPTVPGDVFGKVFRPAGQTAAVVRSDFPINSFTSLDQYAPSLAMARGGRFVVTWTSNAGNDGNSGDGVFGQRFEASGNPRGVNFQINATTPGHQNDSAVAINKEGEFVVVWRSYASNPSTARIYSRRYSGAEELVATAEQEVSTGAPSHLAPSVALTDSGNALVTWTRPDAIYGQWLNPAGGKITPALFAAEFRVHESTLHNQDFSSVAIGPGGEVTVVYLSDILDGNGWGVFAQRIDATGVREGEPRRLNQYFVGEQAFPFYGRHLAMDGSGNYFAVWQSQDQDGSGYGIYATKVFVVDPEIPQQFQPAAAGEKRMVKVNTSGFRWRVVGKTEWIPRDDAIENKDTDSLAPGEYFIEFEPKGAGQPAPPAVRITVPADGTGVVERTPELALPGGANGTLTVAIEPEAVAANLVLQERGQWRFADGAGANPWRNGGLAGLALAPGAYRIEFRAVDGRVQPTSRTVLIKPGATTPVRVVYEKAAEPPPQDTAQPAPVPLAEVQRQTAPFCFAGQFASDAGFASGMVVKQRVVLTAAHVVFDDVTLTYTTGLLWRFQRMRGDFEPVPLTPRGSYVLSSYAALRRTRASGSTLGTAKQSSQQRDAAAVFFSQVAGRSGFTDVLPTTVDSVTDDAHWLAAGRLKTLVSYPVDPAFLTAANALSEADAGKMFATPPRDANFLPVDPETPPPSEAVVPLSDPARGANRVFSTTQITGHPGSSGGALCVQTDEGSYFPAAIYLGGDVDVGRSVVRVIDATVTGLIAQAEDSAQTDRNNTGGGIVRVDSRVSAAGFRLTRLKVDLLDDSGRELTDARWRVGQRGDLKKRTESADLPVGKSLIYFLNAPAGFSAPNPFEVEVATGEEISITGTYVEVKKPLLTTAALKAAILGEDYKFQLKASGSPTAFSAPALAALGLQFNAKTGLITGKPNAAGEFEIPVTVTKDKVGTTDRTYRLRIAAKGVGLVSVATYHEGSGKVAITPASAAGPPANPPFSFVMPQGERVTLTARPNAGSVFKQWKGAGIAGLPSDLPKLTFDMPEAVEIEAEFVGNPFPDLAGPYRGLLRGGATRFTQTGLAEFTVAKTGAFSGKFIFGGATYPLSGRFKVDGGFNGQIKARGKDLEVALTLGGIRPTGPAATDPPLVTRPRKIEGTVTVTDDSGAFVLNFDAVPPRALLPPPNDKRERSYTLKFAPDPAQTAATFPQGSGVATLQIRGGRTLRAQLYLADGAKTTVSGFLTDGSTGAQWPLFAELYGRKGAMLGDLTITDNLQQAADDTVAGTVRWFRPSDAKLAQPFGNRGWGPNGLASEVTGFGYLAPARDLGVLAALDEIDSVPIELKFGGSGAAGFAATLSQTGKITPPAQPAPNPQKLTLTLQPKTGLLTGSYMSGDTKKRTFTGVLLRPLDIGEGFILGPTESAPFRLELAAP